MISPDIQAPEEAVVNIPELPPPIPLRRSKNMAESIALNTKANNGLPLNQILNFWGVQRDIHFVTEILDSPVYEDILPKERERLLLEASQAIAHNWIERQGFKATPLLRYDKIYPFWNAGYEL